jgi:hypothetical protein
MIVRKLAMRKKDREREANAKKVRAKRKFVQKRNATAERAAALPSTAV